MERQIAPAVEWTEVIHLGPSGRESWACCLEPGEVISITLVAASPIDAVLLDWDAYEAWRAYGEDDMPASAHFANDTRSVSWEGQPAKAPYVMAVVVFNPGRHRNSVTLEARVRATKPDQSPSNRTGSEAPSPDQAREMNEPDRRDKSA